METPRRLLVLEEQTLQQLYHEFQRTNAHAPSGTDAACRWAVERGLLELPDFDPYSMLASQMASALRAETATDDEGRTFRVNHAARITRYGVQQTLWAEMWHAGHEHMERAFTQRREQIIGDCAHLKADVDAYNRLSGDARPMIQLILDFTDDVAEREALREAA